MLGLSKQIHHCCLNGFGVAEDGGVWRNFAFMHRLGEQCDTAARDVISREMLTLSVEVSAALRDKPGGV